MHSGDSWHQHTISQTKTEVPITDTPLSQELITPPSDIPNQELTNSEDDSDDNKDKDDDSDDDKKEDEDKDVYDDNPSPSDIEERTLPQANTQTPTAPVSTNTYTNGTYNASQTYRTPDGTYTINVSATISDDTISSATVQFDSKGAKDGYSRKFTSAYQSTVIRKDLETVHPSRIGGASLTTAAFNKTLDSIRSQAS